jgi:calcium/calmodulin-dependent protein kinase kinase 2
MQNHPWVTKRGADPLLSEEENTAEILGLPTDEEMNSAITSKMGNLLVVV